MCPDNSPQQLELKGKIALNFANFLTTEAPKHISYACSAYTRNDGKYTGTLIYPFNPPVARIKELFETAKRSSFNEESSRVIKQAAEAGLQKLVKDNDAIVANIVNPDMKMLPNEKEMARCKELVSDIKLSEAQANILFRKFLNRIHSDNSTFERWIFLFQAAERNDCKGAKALQAASEYKRGAKTPANLDIIIQYLQNVKIQDVHEAERNALYSLLRNHELRNAVTDKFIKDHPDGVKSYLANNSDSMLIEWLKKPTSLLGLCRLTGGTDSYKKLVEAAAHEDIVRENSAADDSPLLRSRRP